MDTKTVFVALITAVTVACVLQVSRRSPQFERDMVTPYLTNRYNKEVKWPSFPVQMQAHKNLGRRHQKALIKAMAIWNANLKNEDITDNAFEMTYAIDGEADLGRTNNVMILEDWSYGKYQQAITERFWHEGDSEMLEADVFVNPQRAEKVDLVSLYVHELGHVLGLEHNHGSPSVMSSHLQNDNLRRFPKSADLVALSFVYRGRNKVSERSGEPKTFLSLFKLNEKPTRF